MDSLSIGLLILIIPLFIFMIIMPRMTLNNLKAGVTQNVSTKRFYIKAGIYLLLALYLLTKLELSAKTMIISGALLFLTFWYLYHAHILNNLNKKNQQE